MMLGLRSSQSVETITCTSERSGIASRGVLKIAHSPPPITARANNRTKNALRALHSMRRAIMIASPRSTSRHAAGAGFQSALRVDQEIGRSHHLVPRVQPVDHLKAIPERQGVDLHFYRYEAIGSNGTKRDVALAGADDGGGRHGQ